MIQSSLLFAEGYGLSLSIVELSPQFMLILSHWELFESYVNESDKVCEGRFTKKIYVFPERVSIDHASEPAQEQVSPSTAKKDTGRLVEIKDI